MRCAILLAVLATVGCSLDESSSDTDDVPGFVDAHWQLVCPLDGPLDCQRDVPHDLFGYDREPNDIHGDEGELSVNCQIEGSFEVPDELRATVQIGIENTASLRLDFFLPGPGDAPFEGTLEAPESTECDVDTRFFTPAGERDYREVGECGPEEACVIGPTTLEFHDAGLIDIRTQVLCTELATQITDPRGHHLELGQGAPPGTPAIIDVRNCEDYR